ncbi:MAG: hypothetical protein KC933_00420 [Myxococcales bacterium]|nr:hypothetical protein [Myxococcales bacterium]MCB9649587.1 hypothetical protein [Deltaproteobacteria bacterium]
MKSWTTYAFALSAALALAGCASTSASVERPRRDNRSIVRNGAEPTVTIVTADQAQCPDPGTLLKGRATYIR